ncbi:MAG: nitroreductase family protein [Armatimonadota bacterium]|nr:nitroreductase family protein [Armatimonadota bacterium]
MIRDLVRANRSYRRFQQERRIEEETLRELVDLARMSPSAANLQPLKYIISAASEKNALIFPTLAWAGYLKDWPGPEEGEQPSAYIIVLGDTEISKNVGCDQGIACQSILLGAAEKGIGGCMIGSINRQELRDNLAIPERYEIILVVALGYPKETIELEQANPEGEIRYYRDQSGVHHVPKRSLEEIILSDGSSE